MATKTIYMCTYILRKQLTPWSKGREWNILPHIFFRYLWGKQDNICWVKLNQVEWYGNAIHNGTYFAA